MGLAVGEIGGGGGGGGRVIGYDGGRCICSELFPTKRGIFKARFDDNAPVMILILR